MSTVVHVSRKWHNPLISVTVDNQEIGLTMTLDDYLLALSKELKHPITIVSRRTLLKELRLCAAKLEIGIKESSIVNHGEPPS